MNFIDDLDTPNTAPGYCPECGQKANIWAAVSQQWECSFCDWKGRNPNPSPAATRPGSNQPEYLR